MRLALALLASGLAAQTFEWPMVTLAFSDAPDAPVARKTATVMLSPVSLASGEALSGPAREAALWNVSLCAGAVPVNVPRERIQFAAPSVRMLTPAQSDALLARRTRRSKTAIAGRILQYAAIGAAIASTPWAAVAVPVIDQLQDRAKEAAPVYRIGEPLEPVLVLQAGQCATRTVLAARMSGAQAIGPLVIVLP